MARAGRGLEALVAALERVLGRREDVRVESPAWLPDVDTGQPREVDVAVRIEAGTHRLLVVLECRDRKARGDATWIEQVHAKRRSVGADRVVAVSASGFTAPALAKARRLDVETRTLQEVEAGDDWRRLPGFDLEVVRDVPSILGFEVTCDPAPLQEAWPHAVPPRASPQDDAVFLRADTGRRFSMRDLVGSDLVWPHVGPRLTPERVEVVELSFVPRRVATDHAGALRWVLAVRARLQLREERDAVRPTRVHRYATASHPLAYRAEFDGLAGVRIVTTTRPRAEDAE